MSTRRISSIVSLFRADPATSSLLLFAPLTLAAGQLLNSYVNGVSPVVSLAFAVTMVAFAVAATGHHAAEQHLRTLESEFGSAN
ncbi:hypothetical protein [Halosolutus halophilus]|uniref:hypothetical protein n=1 Tax=Halosolutus halophilus TaxID=1552990 RepID=UPI0022350FC1|nr:hypothetical protein [Halosolutus halophilus]